MRNRKLQVYILVRRDLPGTQPAVQACHALAELLTRFGNDVKVREWAERHHTLVLLGLPHERALLEWEQELTDSGIDSAAFREPDRNHEMTALAIHPAAEKRRFRRLSLL